LQQVPAKQHTRKPHACALHGLHAHWTTEDVGESGGVYVIQHLLVAVQVINLLHNAYLYF